MHAVVECGVRSAQRRRRAAARRLLLTALVFAGALPNCTPEAFRRSADRVAYQIIEQKQAEALGRAEAFSVETPAQTLRRRLLLEQHLPVSDPGSFGRADIQPITQWPDADYLQRPEEPVATSQSTSRATALKLSLDDVLQIAAAESREYQAQKESVFVAALQLDLERNEFRLTWSGVLTALFQSNLQQTVVLDDEGRTDLQTVSGLEYGGSTELTQRLRNGLSATGAIGLDLVTLLTQRQFFSRGVFADVTATLPLMRGAGEFVVSEPLTQAERNVIYSIYQFERFKQAFAVDVASEYLSVLQQQDSVRNAEDNYRNLIASTRRARRLADAGRLPEIQVDQSRQDELRARQRWVGAQEQYQRQLDGFKTTLGLPVDARIELDRAEFDTLTRRAHNILQLSAPASAASASAPASRPGEAADAPVELLPPGQGAAGPYELAADAAVQLALQQRLDLRVAIGRVLDSQRVVAVAADQLRADVTLLGSGSAGARRTLGSVGENDAILRPDEGSYSALLTIDLPFERTAERNTYRISLLDFEQSLRDVQELEDQIKLAVRTRLSQLLEARESIQIQAQAVEVARRRVDSTNLFLEAGRAEIRDVLEAQEALVSAQNALTAALIDYRVSELSLQRDLGVLEVNEKGLWREYTPPQEGAGP